MEMSMYTRKHVVTVAKYTLNHGDNIFCQHKVYFHICHCQAVLKAFFIVVVFFSDQQCTISKKLNKNKFKI